jgi:hypothetical protein
MQVAVLGGTGFLGSRVVAALTQSPSVRVLVAHRRAGASGTVVHVERPSTFAVLNDADVIVNLTDTTRHSPELLVQHCLDRGKIIIEPSSDTRVVEALYQRHASRESKGALVLGAGIFTGLSNLAASASARLLNQCESLELGVSTTPFSGAGAGTIELMAGALCTDARRVEEGQLRYAAPISPGPVLDFFDVKRSTIEATLAEPFMLGKSLGVRNVRAYLALRPSFLGWVFQKTPLSILRSRWFGAYVKLQMSALRRFLLRDRPTAVQLIALARGGQQRATVSLTTKDGMLTAAYAIAAIIQNISNKNPRPQGVCFIDQVCQLDAIVQSIQRMAGTTLGLQVHQSVASDQN